MSLDRRIIDTFPRSDPRRIAALRIAHAAANAFERLDDVSNWLDYMLANPDGGWETTLADTVMRTTPFIRALADELEKSVAALNTREGYVDRLTEETPILRGNGRGENAPTGHQAETMDPP